MRASPPDRSARKSSAAESTCAAGPHSPRSSARSSSTRICACGQRLELVHPSPREQRRVDLEVRVLGRRADQGQEPLLHGRQQRVLLRLVEAVDLVQEEDRAPAAGRRAAGGLARSPRGPRPGRPAPRSPPRTPRPRPRRSGAPAWSCRSPAGRGGSSSGDAPPRSRAAGPTPAPAADPGRRTPRACGAAAAWRAAHRAGSPTGCRPAPHPRRTSDPCHKYATRRASAGGWAEAVRPNREPRRARLEQPGSIHAPGQVLVEQRLLDRRWIACRLDFSGRRRTPLMARGSFTELFFLDEATALAAGHRPCGECRYKDYEHLTGMWAELHPGQIRSGRDRRAARRRAARPRTKQRRFHEARSTNLPTGRSCCSRRAPRGWRGTRAGRSGRRRRPRPRGSRHLRTGS